MAGVAPVILVKNKGNKGINRGDPTPPKAREETSRKDATKHTREVVNGGITGNRLFRA